jgi:hypothetical protein
MSAIGSDQLESRFKLTVPASSITAPLQMHWWESRDGLSVGPGSSLLDAGWEARQQAQQDLPPPSAPL